MIAWGMHCLKGTAATSLVHKRMWFAQYCEQTDEGAEGALHLSPENQS